jgi:putative aldouronate transport system permease protein
MTFLQYHVINFKTSDLRPEQIAANPALADLDGRAIKSAGIVLCTLPILCLYPFLQRYFVTGMVMGSVKE